jgi:hypothetical protein
MLLKILVYSVAIWFFVRVIRRVARLWFGIPPNRSFGTGTHQHGSRTSAKHIDDVDDAVFTEIDDKH